MSFRIKTIVGIALIEAVLLFILIYSSLNLLKTSNEEEFRKRADTVARLFATAAKEAVLSMDLASLKSLVSEVLTNPGIVYARVRGTRGTLAQGGDIPSHTGRFEANEQNIGNGIFDAQHEIAVQGVTYGTVEIGFSHDAIEATLDRARVQTLVIAGIEMGLVVLLSFFLGWYLTRGLDALKEGSRRLMQGNLGYQIDVRGKDELAQAARAFNEMSQQLKIAVEEQRRVQREITQLNKDLEQRVQGRTQELARLNKELEHLALHDSLTSLPNRMLFSDRLEHAIQLGRRESKCFAVVIIDLDRFKEINDSMGHHAGDLVLQETARRLRETARGSDTVARLGGDEFALLLLLAVDSQSSTRVAAIETAANRFLNVLSQPVLIADKLSEIGASLGISLFPEHGSDAASLLRHADVAMYDAKSRRAGFTLYRSGLER